MHPYRGSPLWIRTMQQIRIARPLAALPFLSTALAAGLWGPYAVAGPPSAGNDGAAAQAQTRSAEGAAPFKVVTSIDPSTLHIFQDSKGTYWFGSHEHGLFRWDGKAIAQFTTESGLSGNGILKIQEDKLGNLYISTSAGISKFDGRAFTTLKVDESDPAAGQWKLEPDDLWFYGGQDSRAIFRYDGKSLRKLTFPPTPEGEAHIAKYPRSKYPSINYTPYDVYTTYRDSRGNIWFGTASLGACRYDGKSFSWMSQFELGFREKGNRTFGTRSIMEDRDGKFWITATRFRFDLYPEASAVRSADGLAYSKSEGLVHSGDDTEEDYSYMMSIVRDKAGDLWMATYGAGVWRYDGKTLKNYPVLVDGKPITVYSIYKDREDSLWLGTHEHGVCKFNGKSFEKVKF